ncbi:transcription factor [Macrococcus hajekii]|nr:competence protein CoiA family protein [Macrococcus hajekii]GGA98835.1 transcription factor [Macrococcus hajekii]
MLIAVSLSGVYTPADHACTSEQYRCPVCLKPVVLKKGRYKIAHFSHQRIIDCYKSTYKTESLAHLQGKHQLYNMSRGLQVDMEYYLSDIEQIPDILIERRLAVELQLSVIPVDAIIRRSAGYRRLGMDVIWIADELKLTKQGDVLKLTAFQRSLVETSRMQLYSFDSEQNIFYCYQLTELTSDLQMRYIRSEIQTVADFTAVRGQLSACIALSNHQKKGFIRQCLKQKDVREPTLSALYQLRIQHQQLPASIGIVVPLQFFIRTHPITWQSQLLLALKQQTFSVQAFAVQLEYYGVNDVTMTSEELTAALIRQYSAAYNKLYVQY